MWFSPSLTGGVHRLRGCKLWAVCHQGVEGRLELAGTLLHRQCYVDRPLLIIHLHFVSLQA